MENIVRRLGRKPHLAKPGEYVSLRIRITPTIKNRIDAAAKENGRTQSREAESRLERSFDRDEILKDILAVGLFGKTNGTNGRGVDPKERPSVEVLTSSIPIAGAMAGLNRSSAYAAAKEGSMPTVTIAGKLRVPLAKWRAKLNGETP